MLGHWGEEPEGFGIGQGGYRQHGGILFWVEFCSVAKEDNQQTKALETEKSERARTATLG